MGGEPGADLTAAVEIAIAATQFDWTWTAGDAERFAEYLGWGASSVQREDWLATRRAEAALRNEQVPRHVEMLAAVYPERVSIVHGDSPGIRFPSMGEAFTDIIVDIAPARSDDDPDYIDLAFEELDTRFRALWGAPTAAWAEPPQGWNHPQIVVDLCASGGKTYLRLQSRAERDRIARREVEIAEKVRQLTDPSTFLAVIPPLVHADPGTWSATDVLRITESTGWPNAIHENPILRDHPLVELDTDREWIRLLAVRAPDRPDTAEELGSSEFESLNLRQRLSAEVSANAFRVALEHCVRLLGPPPRIGGGRATCAEWRRETSTIMLSHDSESLTSVSLTVSPTTVRENATREGWEINRGRNPYDSWRATPDDGLPYEEHAGYEEWHYVEAEATTWARFKTYLRQTFESLATDVALLHPYVGRVEWTLGRCDEPNGWLARGCFGDKGSRLEILGADGQARAADYPPERASGRDISIAVLTALRERGIDSPSRLWCAADIPTKPQRLLSFRLGLSRG
ncbi:hypothetical protein [Nocardia heshunensis]